MIMVLVIDAGHRFIPSDGADEWDLKNLAAAE
jgi:hypothetical protein